MEVIVDIFRILVVIFGIILVLCLIRPDVEDLLHWISGLFRAVTIDDDVIERSDEDQKRAVELHDDFRNELLKRQLSNSENYDRAILSLSTAGLALSITAIKFIIPLETAKHLLVLKFAWFLFFIVISTTILAYLIGNIAITKQLAIAEDYYINKSKKAHTQRNWLASINRWLNFTTGILFIAAIFLIIFFVIKNI